MAYADEFNVNTPSGAEFKSQGDDRIRELKRAISQRLATAFTNWPDGDPLEVDAERLSERLTVGYGPALPEPPTDDFFYHTGEQQLYVVNAAGDAYVLANVIAESTILTSDTLANMPNPVTTPFFFATDTNALYVKEGDAYTLIELPASSVVKRARMGLSANQVLLTNTFTQIEYDVEVIDQGNYYDPASLASPNEFVISEAGIYQFIVQYSFNVTITAAADPSAANMSLFVNEIEGSTPWADDQTDTEVALLYAYAPYDAGSGPAAKRGVLATGIVVVPDGVTKRVRVAGLISLSGDESDPTFLGGDSGGGTHANFFELIRLGDAP